MLATNGKIKKATLTVEKAGDKDADGKPLIYYRLILSDAYISSYKICGEELDDEFGTIPRDEFSINFRKIDVEYTEQHRSGGGAGAVMFSDELDFEPLNFAAGVGGLPETWPGALTWSTPHARTGSALP